MGAARGGEGRGGRLPRLLEDLTQTDHLSVFPPKAGAGSSQDVKVGCRVQLPSLTFSQRTRSSQSIPSWTPLQAPRGSRQQEAWATRSETTSLYLRPISSSPPPGSGHWGRAPQVGQAVPCSGPGARPLPGGPAANQADHARHWPLSLTPAIPHPAPATTQGHICLANSQS